MGTSTKRKVTETHSCGQTSHLESLISNQRNNVAVPSMARYDATGRRRRAVVAVDVTFESLLSAKSQLSPAKHLRAQKKAQTRRRQCGKVMKITFL